MNACAKWIELDRSFPAIYNASLTVEFRREFELAAAPDDALLSISGMGFYDARINGKPVTDHLLTPAFTAYDKRVYYDEYDVTALLQPGRNEITVHLGAGWYAQSAPDAWEFEHATWRAPLQMIAEISTGGECILATNSTWEARESKLMFSQLREGETYDSTLPEAPWRACRVSRGPGGVLEKYDGPAIEIEEILEPVSVTRKSDGHWVYDFGVNLAGNCEITVSGAPGSRISMQYAEKLSKTGYVDMTNINSLVFSPRFQTDEYVLAGAGEETWRSTFTYNGFRYVCVKGNAKVISLRARSYHTQLPEIGGFECDHPLINAIQSAVLRSTKTNFHHMPTDCPHREKNGWTGDAHLSCEQALINLDISPAYRKWMKDIADAQRPNGALPGILPTSVWGYNWGNGVSWDCACIVIPWQTYMSTGDVSFLRNSFPVMTKYMRYMTSLTENHISTIGLGDWCPPPEVQPMSTPALLTAISIRMYELMEKICTVLGEPGAEEYAALAKKTRAAFRDAFIGKCEDSQGYLATLLWFGLADNPADAAARLAKQVEAAGYHIRCGIFGAKFLFEALTDNGYFDHAWKVATQTDYPSFGYMLSNGSGTLWENFSGRSSLNHHMFSPISAWFHKDIAGVHILEPGYKKVRIAPHIPEGMKFFRAWHDSPLGRLEVRWQDDLLTVTAPAGMELEIDADLPVVRA